jgi:formamidopyrimidine-DNA glycosylase
MPRSGTTVPELPEVETVRRDVEAAFVKQAIQSAEVTGLRSTRRHRSPDEVASKLECNTIEALGRKGKYLLVNLASGDVLVVHLGMSGQLRVADSSEPLVPHTHAVLQFSGGRQLRFVDPRTFGEIFVATPRDDGSLHELSHLGPDALDELPTRRRLTQLLAARRTRLKPLLLDQGFLAGIGNIYSDEILHRAGLRHDRVAAGLSPPEVVKIRNAAAWTLRKAVAERGSTLNDLQYRDLRGGMGGYQRFHKVYGREGAGCTRCGSTIVRETVAGRSTFYCPQCQI